MEEELQEKEDESLDHSSDMLDRDLDDPFFLERLLTDDSIPSKYPFLIRILKSSRTLACVPSGVGRPDKVIMVQLVKKNLVFVEFYVLLYFF